MNAGEPACQPSHEKGLIVVGLLAGRQGAAGALPGLTLAGLTVGELVLFGQAEVGEAAREGGLGVSEWAEDAERRLHAHQAYAVHSRARPP